MLVISPAIYGVPNRGATAYMNCASRQRFFESWAKSGKGEKTEVKFLLSRIFTFKIFFSLKIINWKH